MIIIINQVKLPVQFFLSRLLTFKKRQLSGQLNESIADIYIIPFFKYRICLSINIFL